MHDQHLDRDRDPDKAGPGPEDVDVDADAGASERSRSFLARETGAAARARTTDASAQDSEVSGGLVDKMVGSPTTALPHGDSYGSGASSVVAHGGPELRSEMAGAGIEGLTYGNHVAFSSASPGRDVVQHELAHVAQQSGGGAGSRADDEAGASRAESMSPSAIGAALGGGAAAAPIARARKPDPARPKRPPGFEVASGPPGGELVKSIKIDLPDLPADLRAGIEGEPVSVKVALLVDGDTAIVHVDTGDEHWVARASATEVANALFGPLASEALAMVGTITGFIEKLKTSGTLQGTKIRLDLWKSGTPEQQSFATFDLAKVASGLGRGSASGFRPVEARILAGEAGGVRIFDTDGQVPLTEIGGSPIGGWFPVPDEDGTIHKLLGAEGKGAVSAGVFYEAGVMSVAVKENDAAKTGIAASVNLKWLLAKLKQLGGKALDFLEKLIPNLDGPGFKFPNVDFGLLKFDFPDLGGFLEFDFKLQLPRLFKGGGGGWGFSLSGLWPSGFSFSLPGGGLSFGALPRMNFDWLKMPKLGSFGVSFDRLKGLLGDLPGLPTLPSFDIDLHFAGDLSLGLSIDLSKLWPDFGGGDGVFGFELDLGALLDKLAGAGQWLLDKLRKAKNWFNRYIHLGNDGVLRIYDAKDDRALVGFHLLRLLDGAQPTDLAPTELRWEHGKDGKEDFTFEVGEAAPDDGSKPGGPKDKVSPKKPAGKELFSGSVAAPGHLAEVLALEKGAAVDAALFWDLAGETVSVWASAPSDVYGDAQAVTATARYTAIAQAIARRIPEGKRPKPLELPIAFDDTAGVPGARFNFGDLAGTKVGAGGKAGGVSGHVFWKLERLLGANDWTDLAPDELVLDVAGAAKVELGAITDPTVGDQRFAVNWKGLRQDILHADDDLESVWLGLHKGDDVVGISATKDEAGGQGIKAQVQISFLLRQLERLGKLGERVLDAIAKAAGFAADLAGSFADKVAAIAKAVGDKLLDLANGILKIDLGRGGGTGWLSWDLKLQLPRLGFDFDFSNLIPDFKFDIPGLPGFSLAWLPSVEVGGFKLPAISLPALRLGKLFDGLPGFDLSKLKGDFTFNVGFLDDLSLDIGIDLSSLSLAFPDLFGGGGRGLGFKIPLGKLLDKLQQAGQWLKDKLGKVGEGFSYLDLGPDGILRIRDPKNPTGNRVGYDLTRLLDGVEPSDLIPVELHAELESKGNELAELSFGDRKIDADDKKLEKDEGKVLVRIPKPEDALFSTSFAAPKVIREHLGADDGANVRAALHKEKADAVVYASVDGSDRGVELRVHADKLAQAADAFGKVKVPGTVKGIRLDEQLSAKKKALVVAFGTEQEEGKDRKALGGHVAWKLPKLLDGLSIEDAIPDELEIGNKDAALKVAETIDTKGLDYVATVPLPDFAAEALPGRSMVKVYADLKGDVRLAVVAPEDGAKEGEPAPGLMVTLDDKFVARIEMRLKELADSAREKVGKAFSKISGASKAPKLKPGNIHLAPSQSGMRVERGKEGEADHVYATFGWEGLMQLASGNLDLEKLVPVEFRVATKAMSLEVEDMDEESQPEHPPEGSHKIGGMHPLFSKTLVDLGMDAKDWLRLEAGASEVADEEGRWLNAIGVIYNAENDDTNRENVNVQGRKRVTAKVSLDALLAQVLPKRRRFDKPKDEKKLTPGSTRTNIDLGPTDDLNHDKKTGDHGVEMSLEIARMNKKGKTRELAITAGWSLEQILDLLVRLDEVIDESGMPTGEAASLLVPQVLRGSFASDKFKLTFGNDGAATDYNTSVSAVPGLGEVLQAFLPAATVAESKIHLAIADPHTFVKGFKDALISGDFVELASCAIEVPQEPKHKFYEITFSASAHIFRKLLYLIPYAGQILKLVDMAAGILKDPVGTLESIAYTPELLGQMWEFRGDIADALKDMSLKEILLTAALSDASTKQAAMAGRIYRKLKKAGWKKGDKKPADLGNIPDDYLEWLGKQDEQALKAFMELSEKMQKLGLETGDDEYTIPKDALDLEQLEHEAALLAADYTEFFEGDKQAKASGDPALEAKWKEKGEALRKRADKFLKGGAKKSVNDVEDKRGEDQEIDPDKIKATEPDHDLTNVTGLPPPKIDQEEQARRMFNSKDAYIHQVEADYLIQKFAGLSTEQLGDLLTNGQTSVQTNTGPVVVPMFEDERGFVRQLFLMRVDPSAKAIKRGAKDAVNDPSTDKGMVEAWRSGALGNDGAQGVKPGDQADKAGGADKGDDKGDGTGGTGTGTGGQGGDKNAEDEDIGDMNLGEDEEWMGGKEPGEGGQEEGGYENGLDRGEDVVEGEEGQAEEGQAEENAGGGDSADKDAEPEIDDAHLFRASPRNAKALTTWDEDSGKIVANKEAIKSLLANIDPTQTTKGQKATLIDIKVESGEDVGEGTKIIEFTIIGVVEIEGVGVQEERYTMMYEPESGEYFQAGGSDAFLHAVRGAIDIDAGGNAKLLGDGMVNTGTYTFQILEIYAAPRKEGEGLYVVPVFVVVHKAPKGGRVKNSADKWVKAVPGKTRLRMEFPHFTKQAADSADSE